MLKSSSSVFSHNTRLMFKQAFPESAFCGIKRQIARENGSETKEQSSAYNLSRRGVLRTTLGQVFIVKEFFLQQSVYDVIRNNQQKPIDPQLPWPSSHLPPLGLTPRPLLASLPSYAQSRLTYQRPQGCYIYDAEPRPAAKQV